MERLVKPFSPCVCGGIIKAKEILGLVRSSKKNVSGFADDREEGVRFGKQKGKSRNILCVSYVVTSNIP
jgi:hypothetical protein